MKRFLVTLATIAIILTLALGAVGCVGSQGSRGPTGSQGPMGPTGSQGIRGEQGFQGLPGPAGPQGARGEQGDDGDRGSQGYPGATGATGLQGVQGPKGDKGDTGGCIINVTVNQPNCYLTLTEKDSMTWQPVVGGASGALVYSPFGDTFAYAFDACALEPDTSYTLIYYADFEDRMSHWGGDNPGAVIGTGATDGTGNLMLQGSVELGMSIPCLPDANINTYGYSGDPDYYAHAHGAKIWLVPTDCLTGGILPVATWSPDRFLFETDLIVYIDTD